MSFHGASTVSTTNSKYSLGNLKLKEKKEEAKAAAARILEPWRCSLLLNGVAPEEVLQVSGKEVGTKGEIAGIRSVHVIGARDRIAARGRELATLYSDHCSVETGNDTGGGEETKIREVIVAPEGHQPTRDKETIEEIVEVVRNALKC